MKDRNHRRPSTNLADRNALEALMDSSWQGLCLKTAAMPQFRTKRGDSEFTVLLVDF